MMRVWRLSVVYIGPKSKTEMQRKTKIDIIGLSLLSNDVDCRHFKDSDGRARGRAGTGRILGFWAFAADRSRAGN